MIKLRITTAGGTKIELDIPIDDSKPASIESAVPYQPVQDTPVEVPAESHGEPVRMFDKPTPVQSVQDLVEAYQGKLAQCADILGDDTMSAEQATEALDKAMWKYNTSPTFPSNEDLENESREGEKGEDGRIGGVGERKEDGEKGEPEYLKDLNFEFPCKGGKYTPPPQLIKNHVATYGEAFVLEEYREAQNWLISSPQKLKSKDGTGRYLSGWLRRSRKFREEQASKMAAIAPRKQNDNLLANANKTTEGW